MYLFHFGIVRVFRPRGMAASAWQWSIHLEGGRIFHVTRAGNLKEWG